MASLRGEGRDDQVVPRPALPPILWCSLMLWGGCSFGLSGYLDSLLAGVMRLFPKSSWGEGAFLNWLVPCVVLCALAGGGLFAIVRNLRGRSGYHASQNTRSIPNNPLNKASQRYHHLPYADQRICQDVLDRGFHACHQSSKSDVQAHQLAPMMISMVLFLGAGLILSGLFITSLDQTRVEWLAYQELAAAMTPSQQALAPCPTSQEPEAHKGSAPGGSCQTSYENGAYQGGSPWYIVRLLDDPHKSLYGYSVTAEIKPIHEAGGLLPPACRIRLYVDSATYTFGDEFQARITLATPSDRALDSFITKGIALSGTLGETRPLNPSFLGLFAQMRSSLKERINTTVEQGHLDTEAAALLKALLVGDRSTLFDTSLYQEVRMVGLAHLVAVSGAHLVIISGLIALVLRAFRLSRKASLVIHIVFLLVYLIMVGFPLSCLRAGCMSIVSLLAFASTRRSSALSALGVIIALFVAIDPSTALSLSFALSVLATLGIIVFMPLFSSWMRFGSSRVRTLVCDPVSMTGAALLLTLPLSASIFAQFSPLVPVANIFATPVITFICGMGSVAFVLSGVPMVGPGILLVAYGGARLFASLMDGLMMIPGIAVPVDVSLPWCTLVAVGIAFALWIIWPQRPHSFRRRHKVVLGALSCIMVAVLVVPLVFPHYESEVIMFDVGQGDAFLVRSEGKTLLIDTGNQTTKLYAALARHGVRQLDGLLLTHADDDHCGCVRDVRGIVACDTIIVAQGIGEVKSARTQEVLDAAASLTGEDQVKGVTAGDSLQVGALRLDVLHPGALTDDGSNDDSLCLLMESDINHDGTSEWRGLFCGDAEAEVLESLVRDGTLGSIDIYKVGHHGSKAALNESLVQTLHPRIALVSVGKDNSYGHPHRTTLDLLDSVGAQVLRSDEQGDVVCSLQADSIKVSSMR